MKSIIDYLEHWANLQPDKLLFEFRDARGKAIERHTYRSFYERTLFLAAHLFGFEGLSKGDRVILAYAPGLEGVAALVACSCAGLIGVPVPVPYSDNGAAGRRLRSIVGDCTATVVLSNGICMPQLRRLTGSERWRLFSTDDLTGHSAARNVRNDNEVLFLQYTSGSTGHPRGVIVTHHNVIANAQATIDHMPIGVSWLPQHHDMGLIGYYLFPIVTGGTNFGFAPSDFLRHPALWLRTMSEVSATYSSSPNFGYEYCLRDRNIRDEDLEGADLSCVRVLMNASEPVRPQTVLRFHRRFARYGLRESACSVAYGLAENTLTVTHRGFGAVRVNRQSPGPQLVPLVGSGGDSTVEYACCGVPAIGVSVRITDLTGGQSLGPLNVGEIQVAGASVTSGYWNNDDLTNRVYFTATDKCSGAFERYIRTGDLGFLYQDQLYVCGRTKDLIIIGGVNFYPDDLEEAVATSAAAVRPGGICAFQVENGCVVVVAEARRQENIPDPSVLAKAVREACSVMPDLVLIVAPKSVAKTTSGKISRANTRALYESGALSVLASYRTSALSTHVVSDDGGDWRAQLRRIFIRHDVSDEDRPLSDLGIDSLALTEVQLEVEQTLRRVGADALAEAVDGPLLQRLSVTELLSALAPLDLGFAEGIPASLAALSTLHATINDAVNEQMRLDHRWLAPEHMNSIPAPTIEGDIVLTGATGFFGPFILAELLWQTDATIVALVRGQTPVQALERIEAALSRARLLTRSLQQALRARVCPLCGDLSLPFWGLTPAQWKDLTCRAREIFHNGACVNYVMTYESMRATNVEGTRTALRLAYEGRVRSLHLISSTFMFGWTVKGILMETDCNAEMHALDFGYAQTKWVAEQLALGARVDGLDVRIYRPALISVSTQGAGDANDVVVRLLSFMIRHGIAVNTSNQLSILPADVIAHNIVGISQLSGNSCSTLHVTADRYYNMTDLTRVISRDFGYSFEYFDIPGFIDQINRLCSPRDPVYPLLDFFNRSADKVAAMQLKRYSTSAYQHARSCLRDPLLDPPLRETARYIMRYLVDQRLIDPVTDQ
jgi:thioester reductase-like protein